MKQEIKNRLDQINRGEVPEGYKDTSFGIFPFDWRTTGKLKDICEINPKTKALDDEFLYIDLESVVDGRLVLKNTIYKKDAPSRAQRVLTLKDVIYQMVRPYQKNNYIFLTEFDFQTVASTGYAQLRGQNYTFIYQLINSNYFCNQVLDKCTGTNYPAINSKELEQIHVAYPILDAEQNRIAEILMKCDEGVALQEEYIQKLELRKSALMTKVLTPKANWKECKLGSLCSIKTGNKDVVDKVIGGEYPFFIRSEKIERINTFSFDDEGIFIPGDGKIGEILHYYYGKCDYHQRVYCLFRFAGQEVKFFYYYMKKNFYKRAMVCTAKATVDSIRMEMLTGMIVHVPDIKEQKRIADVLSKADEEIQLNKDKLAKMKEQQKSLMQLLLTGIVRVG